MEVPNKVGRQTSFIGSFKDALASLKLRVTCRRFLIVKRDALEMLASCLAHERKFQGCFSISQIQIASDLLSFSDC